MVEKSQTELEKEEKRNKNEEFRRKRQCIYINKMNGLWKIYEKKWMDFEKNMNEKKNNENKACKDEDGLEEW